MTRPPSLALAGLVVAVVLYVCLAAPLVAVPLRGDEALWPRQAHAIDVRGIPKVPFGADAYVWTKASFAGSYGADYGLWHPPGYLYLLAAAQKVDDDWRVSGRLLALLLGLATLVVQFVVTRWLALRAEWSELRASGAATFGTLALATAPYWVFESMLVDMDPGALSLATLGAAAGIVGVAFKPTAARTAALVGLLVAVLWVKPTSYPFIGLGALGFALLARDRRLALRLVAALGLGIGVFAATWAAYVAVSDIPWDYPWRFSYWPASSSDGRGSGSLHPGSLFTIVNTARILVSQLGWPTTAIMLAAVVGLFVRALRRRRPCGWDALTLVGLSTVLFFVVLFPFPGKYVLPGFAPLVAAGALELVAALGALAIPRRTLATAAAAVPVVLLFQWLVVGDMITGPKHRAATEKSFAGAGSDPRIVKYLLALLPIVALWALLRYVGPRPAVAALVVTLAAVVVPWNVGETLAVRPQQKEWILPTRETGYLSVVRWVRANVGRGDLIESYYDIGITMRRGRIIPIDQFGMSWSMTQAARALETRPVRYVLLSEARPPDAAYMKKVDRLFRPIRSLGDWVVYERAAS